MKAEIYNELKEVSPLLADMKNQPGFKIPSEYFVHKSAEIHRMLGIDIVEEVPRGYFDQLPDQIIKKAQSHTESPNARVISIQKIMAIAAVFLVGFIALLPFFNNDIEANTNITLADISVDEQLDYLIEEDMILFTDITEYLDDNDINEIGIGTIENDEVLLDYIEEEDFYDIEGLW